MGPQALVMLPGDTITSPVAFDKTVRYFYDLTPSLCNVCVKMAALQIAMS